MPLFEDVLKGNIVVALALGTTALLLPRIFPELPPPLRSVIKDGLSLLLEAEAEAEGGIILKLADATLARVLDSLAAAGPEAEREEAAQDAIKHFKHVAHRRARRYARNESDRTARYDRHVAALRDRLDAASDVSHRAKARALEQLAT